MDSSVSESVSESEQAGRCASRGVSRTPLATGVSSQRLRRFLGAAPDDDEAGVLSQFSFRRFDAPGGCHSSCATPLPLDELLAVMTGVAEPAAAATTSGVASQRRRLRGAACCCCCCSACCSACFSAASSSWRSIFLRIASLTACSSRARCASSITSLYVRVLTSGVCSNRAINIHSCSHY